MPSKLSRRSVLAAAPVAAGIGLAFSGAAPAIAQTKYKLRCQTHLSEPSVEGQALARFAALCQQFSGGQLEIEMHFSSDIVKETEAFDAARKGIIDGDCTNPSFVTGKEPAFQFFGDLLGGYRESLQLQSWFSHGGGRALADKLYPQFGVHLVGLFFAGVEALSSTKPLRGIADLKDWRFRCPPGMESEIFARLGAKPVVMPFAEVFTAMNTGVVDGCDASQLSLNKQLGLYNIAKYATYPGFHSLPANHLSINLKKWEGLPKDLQRIIEVTYNFAMEGAVREYVATNAKAAAELRKQGITLCAWSDQDLQKYSATAREIWGEWAGRSPMAKEMVDSHIAFLSMLGLLG